MQRVTDILRDAGLRGDMPWMSEEDKQFYMDRGTQIHAATVMLDKGSLDWGSLDERIVQYVQAYAKFKALVNPIVLHSELEVVSRKHDYLGHLDRVFRIGRAAVVCDIKTSECDLATRLQTKAYAMAWRPYGTCKRAGLALHKDSTFRLTWYTEPWAEDVDKAGWLAVLDGNGEEVERWKRKVGYAE